MVLIGDRPGHNLLDTMSNLKMMRPNLPIIVVGTWPDKTTIGVESMYASAIPVTVLVAPGPEVTMTTPGRPLTRA